jgi:hypothetical protein
LQLDGGCFGPDRLEDAEAKLADGIDLRKRTLQQPRRQVTGVRIQPHYYYALLAAGGGDESVH